MKLRFTPVNLVPQSSFSSSFNYLINSPSSIIFTSLIETTEVSRLTFNEQIIPIEIIYSKYWEDLTSSLKIDNFNVFI